MTDALHRYRHSKHTRRVKSALKQKDKVQLRRRLKSLTTGTSNRPKSALEHRRKEWGKLSKKCKPRAQKRAALLPREHIEDYLLEADSSGSDLDSESESGSEHSRAYSLDSYLGKHRIFLERDSLTFSLCGDGRSQNPVVVRDTVKSLMSYQFASHDLKYMRFDMSTFNGQCAYWYHVMERMGVLDEVFYGYYLSRCDDEEQDNSRWYRRKVLSQLLDSIHCLYIFEDIKHAANDQFDRDVASAHPVIQSPEVLVKLLHRHNSEGLPWDLCAIIGDFVMNKGDISWRFHQRDVPEFKEQFRIEDDGRLTRLPNFKAETKEYKVGGHRVMDRVVDGTVIGKVFDGLDITSLSNTIRTLYERNRPMFQPYAREPWSHILMMTMSKFKEYYHRQKQLGLKVEWSMVFAIVLHFIDGADIIDFWDIEVKQRGNAEEKARCRLIAEEALEATEHDSVQQSIWRLFYWRYSHRDSPQQRYQQMLREGLSRCETDHDVSYLCSILMDDRDFFKFDDAMLSAVHRKETSFWKGIWRNLRSDWSVRPVYDLMLEHCQKYRVFVRNCWYYDGDRFSVPQFLWTEIAPMVVDRIVDDFHKEKVIRIVGALRVKATFDEMVSIIRAEERRQDMMWKAEGMVNCECDAMRLVEGRRDKYSRKVDSRRREARRQRWKGEYRKWNGKDDDKRIGRKMRKYVRREDM